MTLFFSFIISLLITMALIPVLSRSAERLQFVDLPDGRKVHDRIIPRVGGIAMAIGVVLPIAMWLTPQREVIGYLLGLAVIVIFGVWDDRNNLNYRIKFLGQIIAVLIVMVYGGVFINAVPYVSADNPLPPYLSAPVTFLFLLGITNAINLSDGLDGLAGGTTLLSVGAMAMLGYTTDNLVVVLIAVAMIGSILGFLRFNTHPAQIFMGDGGSQFLGFSAGVLSVLLTKHGDSPLSAALPLLLLGLPILDTCMVMWQRIRDGRSPFQADKRHIHHKLLALGFSHHEAVLLIYVTQAALVVGAYLMRYQPDGLLLLVFAGLGLSVTGFFYWTSVSGWRVPQDGPRVGGYRRLREYVVRQRGKGYPSRVVCGLTALAVGGYFMASILTAGRVTEDIGGLALVLAAVMAVQTVRLANRPTPTWTDQAGMYVLATLSIFLAQTGSAAMTDWKPWVDGLFVVLAMGIVVGFGLSKHKNFTPTTLDFLVIFAAITIPNLPHVTIGRGSLGESVAKLIILFYGSELVLLNGGRYVSFALRPLVMAMLLIIGIKGVF